MNEISPESSSSPKSPENAAQISSIAEIKSQHDQQKAQFQEHYGEAMDKEAACQKIGDCLLYTSPSPRDA